MLKFSLLFSSSFLVLSLFVNHSLDAMIHNHFAPEESDSVRHSQGSPQRIEEEKSDTKSTVRTPDKTNNPLPQGEELLPSFSSSKHQEEVRGFLRRTAIASVNQLEKRLNEMNPTDLEGMYKVATALRHVEKKWWGLASEIFIRLTNYPQIDPSLKGFCYLGLAKIASRNYNGAEKIKYGEKAIESDPRCARFRIWLGNVYNVHNQTYKGVAQLETALQLAGDIGDKSLQAEAHIGLGNARDGDQKVHYREALRLAGDIGDKSLQAQAHIGLGNARDGDDKAHYREALGLAGEIGDKSLQAQAHIGLGNARDGDRIVHYREALRLAGEIGDESLQAQARIGLGNARAGVENYREALGLAGEIGDKSLQAQAHIGLGNARDGDQKVHYREALRLAEDIKDISLQCHALIGLGNFYCGQRMNEEGEKYFQKALEIDPLNQQAKNGFERAKRFLKLPQRDYNADSKESNYRHDQFHNIPFGSSSSSSQSLGNQSGQNPSREDKKRKRAP